VLQLYRRHRSPTVRGAPQRSRPAPPLTVKYKANEDVAFSAVIQAAGVRMGKAVDPVSQRQMVRRDDGLALTDRAVVGSVTNDGHAVSCTQPTTLPCPHHFGSTVSSSWHSRRTRDTAAKSRRGRQAQQVGPLDMALVARGKSRGRVLQSSLDLNTLRPNAT